VAKLFFIPFSIVSGLLAGMASKRIFDAIWGLIDHEDRPKGKHRDVSWPKLLIGAAIEGAVFRAVKEATDHGSRRAFSNVTGSWPGEERPEPE
jgi:hypothetical protein